ncbi:MAG: GNAT family N-acetyltransferase [Candidatus Aenigmarchaeota archaeon]|nr:GNAT family N-acetyltransferase [Candidatus Aenigmarchaeota archaeon]
MKIQSETVNPLGIKFFIQEGEKEIARAYLYILYNDLHKRPFGFLEDVFVDENYRGKGIGTTILSAVIDEAKKRGCYKLVCTSRYENEAAHNIYKKLGFRDHGKEFRLDL